MDFSNKRFPSLEINQEGFTNHPNATVLFVGSEDGPLIPTRSVNNVMRVSSSCVPVRESSQVSSEGAAG